MPDCDALGTLLMKPRMIQQGKVLATFSKQKYTSGRRYQHTEQPVRRRSVRGSESDHLAEKGRVR